jgi:hypothetical protein
MGNAAPEVPASQPNEELGKVQAEINSPDLNVDRAIAAAKKLSTNEKQVLVARINEMMLQPVNDATRENLQKLKKEIEPTFYQPATYASAPTEFSKGVTEAAKPEHRSTMVWLLGALGVTGLLNATMVNAKEPGWLGWALRISGLSLLAATGATVLGLGREKIQNDIRAANPAPAAPVVPPESEPRPEPGVA